MLVLLIIYALLFFEVFLQVFKPVILTPRYVVDSGYGVRGNWPGAEFTHYSREFGRLDFTINSQGARADRNYSVTKPPGVLRVVAFGDSFTAGFGAQFDQTYLEQMRLDLQRRTNRDVEVINLGVSGHGTAEELVALEAVGLAFSPDVVLFQWHSSDLKENVRAQLFALTESGLTRKNPRYLPAVGIREKLFSYSAYRFIAGNSMFYSWVRNKAARFTKKSLFDRRKGAVEGATSGSLKNTSANNRRAGTPSQQNLSVALLDEARRVSELSGATFQILNVPDRKERSAFESTFPSISGLEEYVYDPSADFGSYFGEMLYWEHSAGHFTPLGNKIVGQGLAAAIADTLNVEESGAQ